MQPWPILRSLKQGDIETTALVDRDGLIVARVTAPETYPGDLRTAVERGDLTAEIVSAATAAPELYEAVQRMLPYFEGEHAYDHPCSVFARAALAKVSPQADGGDKSDG